MDGLNTTPAVADEASIFGPLSELADPLRCRALRLLEDHELSVTELCAVLQLPQSTVSRHLKVLVDGGWIHSRPDGTRRLYRRSEASPDPGAAQLWGLLRGRVGALATSRQDDSRLSSVLARRGHRSRQYFDDEAGGWDVLRDDLFGRHFYLFALVGLSDPDRTVGDLGCGSGPIAEALAPFVRRVIAVDGSAAMLDLAHQRLDRFDNVELRRGELESLPLADGELDAATLCLVLHHLAHPDRAIAEVARVLRPGGSLLIVDMSLHEREEYRHEMGHVWLGFDEPTVGGYLARDFETPRWVSLPARPRAKGPGLFAVTARRRGLESSRTND